MMDLNVVKNLKKEIPGFSFTISDATKRIDGDWHSRWTYSIKDSNGKTLFESDWDGFVTLSKAISSLSKELDCYKIQTQKNLNGNGKELKFTSKR